MSDLILIPIPQSISECAAFTQNPLCDDTLQLTLDYYTQIGFAPPWICYYASINNQLVGSAGYKGAPINGSIEIAYGTFEPFRKQGISYQIAKALVEKALTHNPQLRITACTLAEENYSTKILRKNSFRRMRELQDPEDGLIWEWEYHTDRQ